ncbi:MAG: ketoacyl-ACP synthase III [Bacteroidetes bacterium]|nr:ketoacyl-ACP synthase III [Rhodothermia bacterium]MCS7155853.1 ketoacyl-ACP synthase III [Bacteroidota bacterium]MCX7906046.1 ketoacyl-ACP synthase III [Bacteroidota bacterium]MDW8138174.1 beta-ketoacyl-ACP synthase III [Bacteroidota bacterium]MDW8285858.1 beta-ketoacyl-ACP synthase III [Bacteroidota bacterium]
MSVRAAITAVGHFLPEERLTNQDLERLVDTTDAWIQERTGIRERRVLRDPTKATAYMAARAAEEVLQKRGIEAEELDLIIVATVTPDMFFPATACLVQQAIGARRAWGFDLSAACSGFLFALVTGAQFIATGQHRKVLVIGADKMSAITDYTDRRTCVLFGDAAGAVLLEPALDPEVGILDARLYCDGSGAEALCMKGGGSLNPPSYKTIDAKLHFLYQDGPTVFKRAVEGMADVAAEIMARNGLTGQDVTYLVPHQANWRIIEATARRMGIGREKVMMNIDRYGNTTAATIPLCLYDWEGRLKKGDNLILAAFGAGYTWGAIYLRWAYDSVPMHTLAPSEAAFSAS